MIFAAGLGTRLYPLTKDKPKALAPFANTTLLEYNLRYLSQFGIEKFIVNTHHFADKINEYLYDNEYFNLDITVSFEEELLDTGGGLAKVRELVDEEQILLYNVDVISNIDINRMYKNHLKYNFDISLATRYRETSRYLLFNERNKMIGWKNEKTEEIITCERIKDFQKLAFSGISIINTKLLSKLGKVEKKSIIDFYLNICKDNFISSYQHDSDYWFDCGSLKKLEITEKFIKGIN